MKNAAGREIPDAILERYKKTGYAGAYARDQQTYQKAAPAVRGFVRPGQSKLTGSIREALERCGIRPGNGAVFPSPFPGRRLCGKHGHGRGCCHGNP